MVEKQIILIISVLLFNLNETIPIESINSIQNCKSLTHLNKTMQTNLNLKDAQLGEIRVINQRYLSSIKEMKNNPSQLGYHTKLLGIWDDWRTNLKEHLSDNQMAEFTEWQSTKDLLEEKISKRID